MENWEMRHGANASVVKQWDEDKKKAAEVERQKDEAGRINASARSLGSLDKNKTTDEKVVSDIRMKYAQCALSSMLGTSQFKNLLGNPRTSGGDGNGYRQLLLLDPKEHPADIISSINRVDKANEFFDLDSRIATSLVPYIRIFFLDRENVSHEYMFDLVDTIAKDPLSQQSTMLSSKDARGGDAGLLELTIEDLTSQPAEEGNTLVVNLKLFFRTMRDFLNKGTVDGKFTYSDLVRRKNPNGYFDPLENRLRLIYGYQIPTKKMISAWGLPRSKTDAITKAITHSRRILNLTLRDHTYEIEEDGTVTLDITYNAAIDGILRDPVTNILGNGKMRDNASAMSADLNKRRKQSQGMDDGNEKSKHLKLIKQDEKQLSVYRTAGRQAGFDRIVDELLKGDYLKRIFMPEEVLGALSKKENLTSAVMMNAERCSEVSQLLAIGKHFTSNAQKKAGKNFKRREKNLSPIIKSGEATLGQTGISKRQKDKMVKFAKDKHGVEISGIMREIIFFHYGDLIEVTLKLMKEQGTEFHNRYMAGGKVADHFPIPLLGPVMLRKSTCGDLEDVRAERGVSIADVPIALDTFSNWFVNRIVKRNIDTLIFRDFIDSINRELLPAALGEGCRNSTTGPMVHYAAVQQLSVTKKNASGRGLGSPGEIVTSKMIRERVGKMPRVSSGNDSLTKDYMLIFVPGFAKSDLLGDRRQDGGAGIYHLYLGRDS